MSGGRSHIKVVVDSTKATARETFNLSDIINNFILFVIHTLYLPADCNLIT